MNWQHETHSPLTYTCIPNLWLIKEEWLSADAPATAAGAGYRRRIKISYWVTSSGSLVDKRRFWQKCPASQQVRKEPTKNKFLVNFHFELAAWHPFSSDLPLPPKSLVDKRRMKGCRCCCRRIKIFYWVSSSKSLVDKRRFWQKCPASQHVRKEPTKNGFLVNFCFELTAWHPFSSDLPLHLKSLVDKKRMIVCCCHLYCRCPCCCRCPPPQDQSLLLSFVIKVFGW